MSIIIKTGTANKSAKELAEEIITKNNGINNLQNTNINELCKIKGIGKVKAIEIMAALELGKRVYSRKLEKTKLNSSKDIYEAYRYRFIDVKQEMFYALYFDSKSNFIKEKLLFKGTLNNATVHPREIYKEAYILSASHIIVLHNHPSGDSTPSREDRELTKNLIEISKIMGIKIVDHIIIGNGNYYSFYENNE